jgi:hypothetical protein
MWRRFVNRGSATAWRRWRSAIVGACLCIGGVTHGGCGDSDTPTSPTDTTTTTTAAVAAEPTISEHFTGTLGVGGSAFYSFEVTSYGTVNMTLHNVGGVTGVPESVWVGIGIGVPDATDCITTTSGNTQAGGGPHVSSVLDAGTYCARIYDIGNLAAPTPFSALIVHP